MRKKRLITGTLFALVIIFLVFKQIDFRKIANFKIEINYLLLVIVFLITVFTNLLRAKRFNFILDNSLKLLDVFRVTTFYNLYTGLFPGGLGELSFIYLIKKKIKEHIPAGLSSIIITRIYDILIMSVFLLGTLVMFNLGGADKGKYILFAGAIFILALLAIRYLDKIIGKIIKIFNAPFKNNPFWLNTIKNNLESAAIILKNNKKKNLTLLFYALFFWGSNFFVIQLFFKAFGLSINYLEAILLGVIVNIVALIPINTLASFGYMEGGLVLGLLLIGIPKDQAVIYSFLFHLIIIGFMLGLAFIGLLLGVNFSKIKNRWNVKVRPVYAVLVALALTVVCLFVGRNFILFELGKILLVDMTPEKSDVLVALRGDISYKRTLDAARLYKEGYAEYVFISTELKDKRSKDLKQSKVEIPTEQERIFSILVQLKVPEEKIILDTRPPGGGTMAELTRIKEMMVEKKYSKVIIVTSWYHTRRTHLMAKKVFRGENINFFVVAAKNDIASPLDWWKHRYEARDTVEEFPKIIFFYLDQIFRITFDDDRSEFN